MAGTDLRDWHRSIQSRMQHLQSCAELIKMRLGEQGAWEGIAPEHREYLGELADQILEDVEHCTRAVAGLMGTPSPD